MRKINPNNFQVATRGTSREINRQIALNLVRTHQPISRADLARIMGLRRGAVSLIVNDLLADGLVFEGATGESHRGRKPTFLYIDSRETCVVAVDIRVTRTFLMVTDLLGRQLVGVISFPTEREPKRLVAELGKRIKKVLAEHKEAGACKGVGVVVPGMVDRKTRRIIHAPTLGWRDVEIRESLAAATGLPVHIENSGKACALAQMWAAREVAAFTVEDLIIRARAGDAKAIAALEATARYLGLGLASIVNAVDPARIYIGGEIVAAWDLIEPAVRAGLSERALSPDAAKTEIRTVTLDEHPRLRGAATLVAAPAFAAPPIA